MSHEQEEARHGLRSAIARFGETHIGTSSAILVLLMLRELEQFEKENPI